MPEQDSPQGFVVGFEELYRAVTRLESKIEERFSRIAEVQATHNLRIENLEKAQGHRIESLEKAQGRRWQMVALWITVAASLVAAILPTILH